MTLVSLYLLIIIPNVDGLVKYSNQKAQSNLTD